MIMTAPAPTLSLTQIGQIAITVKDTDRAIRFYRDTLGMRFLFQAGTLGFLDCGGVRLMLTVAETAEFDHPASLIYYRVADIEAAHAHLETQGVAFRTRPHVVHRAQDHDLWLADFADSEGNTLVLMCEKPHAA
jgi:catechol 2,3-dioxygenase-like lactoylglutathione lyase family enzyme